MVIIYAIKSPVLDLAITKTEAAEICESVNIVVDQATAATMRQPQTKFTDLSFADTDEEITNSTLSNQKLCLWRCVKTELYPALRQQDAQVEKLENKLVSLKYLQSIVNLFRVEKKILRKKIMEMQFKHKHLWSRSLGNLGTTHCIINMKEGERPVHQQPYCTR